MATLYDQPIKDKGKVRITGPFTVEAVPAPTVKPLDEIEEPQEFQADNAIAHMGETMRQGEWQDNLLKTEFAAKAGNKYRSLDWSRCQEPGRCTWKEKQNPKKKNRKD